MPTADTKKDLSNPDCPVRRWLEKVRVNVGAPRIGGAATSSDLVPSVAENLCGW
jgi:hypothetical protein